MGLMDMPEREPVYTVRGDEGHCVLLKSGKQVMEATDVDFLADLAVSLNDSAFKRHCSRWNTGAVVVDSPIGD